MRALISAFSALTNTIELIGRFASLTGSSFCLIFTFFLIFLFSFFFWGIFPPSGPPSSRPLLPNPTLQAQRGPWHVKHQNDNSPSGLYADPILWGEMRILPGGEGRSIKGRSDSSRHGRSVVPVSGQAVGSCLVTRPACVAFESTR